LKDKENRSCRKKNQEGERKVKKERKRYIKTLQVDREKILKVESKE
jgi:hypothetical protein